MQNIYVRTGIHKVLLYSLNNGMVAIPPLSSKPSRHTTMYLLFILHGMGTTHSYIFRYICSYHYCGGAISTDVDPTALLSKMKNSPAGREW